MDMYIYRLQLCFYPWWHFCLYSFHFGMTEPNSGIITPLSDYLLILF